MKWASLVVTVAVFITVLSMSFFTRSKSSQKFIETQIALAYACGYRNGQIAITSRLPSLFTDPRDMAGATFECPEIKVIARKHGFDQ